MNLQGLLILCFAVAAFAAQELRIETRDTVYSFDVHAIEEMSFANLSSIADNPSSMKRFEQLVASISPNPFRTSAEIRIETKDSPVPTTIPLEDIVKMTVVTDSVPSDSITPGELDGVWMCGPGVYLTIDGGSGTMRAAIIRRDLCEGCCAGIDSIQESVSIGSAPVM